MALLTGSNKIKTAVFISGTGSNLKSLIKFSKLKKSPISINLILSNDSKSKGLQYGKIFKIKKKIFDFKKKHIDEKKILFDYWKEHTELGWAGAFEKVFEMSVSDFYTEFEEFLSLSIDEQLNILNVEND